MKRNLKISILSPAGNNTALVEGLFTKQIRIILNRKILKNFPSVEQVGFYKRIDSKNAVLQMAGGEFCGNALRSLAYLLLDGKKGELRFKVSGVKDRLKAGVSDTCTAFAQIPILRSFQSVRKIGANIWKVELSGIIHLITTQNVSGEEKEIVREAKKVLQKENLLLSQLAAGVMFVSEDDRGLSFKPVVWVRDVKTMFFESACASGTTAVGLWKLSLTNKFQLTCTVIQPSGQSLTSEVSRDKTIFTYANVEGPISIMSNSVISI